MDAPELVRVEDLRRYFRMGLETVRALDGVSLTINRGEFVCLTGPSGSGKSTLVYLIGGLDQASGGKVFVRGHDLTRLDADELARFRRQTVGFVFQQFNLIDSMTAMQNVEFPMLFSGVSPERRRHRARQLLTLMQMSSRAHHRPTELSGGQQQRIAIARALVNNPPIILADEPTGNLDSHVGQEVIGIFRRLNREEGRTVIVISHDPAVIDRSPRVIRMRDGQVVGDERRDVAES